MYAYATDLALCVLGMKGDIYRNSYLKVKDKTRIGVEIYPSNNFYHCQLITI